MLTEKELIMFNIFKKLRRKKMDNKNNTGIDNSGDWNSGDSNSGYSNSGDRNSGYRNSGDSNSGNWNSGNRNSGDSNSGNWNSGDRNSGDSNSGNWNSGNRNSGSFNTDEPKMRIFNKEIDMTVSEFYDKYDIYADIPLNRWVDKESMTEEEKKTVTGWETMGGYLKTLEFKEACQIWWEENPTEHERFLSLPEFNSEIFKEITGIDTNKPETMIEIDGKKWSASTIQEALKKYINED